MDTRKIEQDILLNAGPNLVFDLLTTPSHVRQWWGATTAIIVPKEGGIWVAQWGSEDHPDYISGHRITAFDPPRKIEMTELIYYARSSTLSFESEFVVTFEIEPVEGGSRLHVTQAGFPAAEEADEFYAGCVSGWDRTLSQIKTYVESL